jgi:hypothetical protein
MFSAFFRSMSNQPATVNVATPPANSNPPSSREILEYNNRCLDTYRQIIDMNKRIAADIKENTRLLIASMPRVSTRTCPNNHSLTQYTALGGNCDVCNRIVFIGEQVMDCRECNWYMCTRCARRNGFDMTPAPMPLQSLTNNLLRTPTTTSTGSELFTFDIPLNGTGFDEFISQLTQTLNQIVPMEQENVAVVPTESQINKACVVMSAREANLSDQYVCPIDLSPVAPDDNVMVIKHCKHAFRENNLRELFTRDVKCPMCRFDIRDHVEVTSGDEDDILDSPLGTFD